MTRKRFLKLVMSHGIQRNEAERIAAGVKHAGSYEALYEQVRPALAFRSMGNAFRRIGRAAHRAACNMRDALAAFGGLCKAALFGVDLAAGEDQSVVVHHVAGEGTSPSVQILTKEEHTAAHAAGRKV